MARRILDDPAEREIRDDLSIAGWVQKPPERRTLYFSWCDQALEMLRRVLKDPGEDPPDGSVIVILLATLKNDGTFWAHVRKKRADYPLEHSDQVHRIGAATIYHEYPLAKEKGRWP